MSSKREKATIEVTEADLICAQHHEILEYVNFGMYEYIIPDNFDRLGPEDLAIYQILARKKYTDKLRESRTMVVTDPDALTRIAWEIERQEMVCSEIVNEIFPEAGIDKLPIFLGDSQTMDELNWYIYHGLPDLINTLNVPALKTIGEENILRLRNEATRQNEIMNKNFTKSNQFGFGVNGNSKVK